jgi:hypothetical protein
MLVGFHYPESGVDLVVCLRVRLGCSPISASPSPIPAPFEQRQPLLWGLVQDPEIPSGLPRPVPLDRSRTGALPGLLPWYNEESPSRRARLHTAADVHLGRAGTSRPRPRWRKRMTADRSSALDLHRRRSVLVRMTEDGRRLGMARIANSPQKLRAQIARAGEPPKVVLEATRRRRHRAGRRPVSQDRQPVR